MSWAEQPPALGARLAERVCVDPPKLQPAPRFLLGQASCQGKLLWLGRLWG